jgi:predicted NBD/HSP70 family sugar kinase
MLDAAHAGDKTALSMLVEAGDAIGRYLAIYCNILDPEVVVVGGEAVIFGDLMFDPMREALARGMLWTPPSITPDWVDNSWAQGAAALATRSIFDFEASSGA